MALQAFLIADIRGYTTYTQQRGDEAGAAMTARFYEIVSARVVSEGGRVIEQRGDEVMAVFDSPRGAIKAAVDIQSKLLEATLADPTIPLAAGIGLDVGEAVEVEGGLRGGAINLAARLCSQAGPGEIFATQELVHLARTLEGIEYLARAAVRLKGLDKPVQPVKIAAEVDPANLWASMPVPGRAAAEPIRTRRLSPVVGGGIALTLLAAGVIAALALTGKGSDDGKKDDDGGGAAVAGGPVVGDCPVFPPDNAWNQPIDDLPLHPDSDKYIASIGADEPLHPDFGPKFKGDEVGIAFNVIDGGVTKVPVDFRYGEESDPGPYPLAPDMEIEDGSDRHVIVVDTSSCTLFELYKARPSGGVWKADSGAIFDLTSNELRPLGWTSADAAGLPIYPGLVRYEEVADGAIEHALRFTAADTRAAFVYPARHEASDSDDPNLPPMGARFRLRADFPIGDYPPQAQAILKALQVYGMMLADNGSDWYLTGEPSELWSQSDIDALRQVHGSDFEAVDTSSLQPAG